MVRCRPVSVDAPEDNAQDQSSALVVGVGTRTNVGARQRIYLLTHPAPSANAVNERPQPRRKIPQFGHIPDNRLPQRRPILLGGGTSKCATSWLGLRFLVRWQSQQWLQLRLIHCQFHLWNIRPPFSRPIGMGMIVVPAVRNTVGTRRVSVNTNAGCNISAGRRATKVPLRHTNTVTEDRTSCEASSSR